MMRQQIVEPSRSYDRTWEEIEGMLEDAVFKQRNWRKIYERARREDKRDTMKEAARNHKALDGVIKTLRWTLGEQGVETPLE